FHSVANRQGVFSDPSFFSVALTLSFFLSLTFSILKEPDLQRINFVFFLPCSISTVPALLFTCSAPVMINFQSASVNFCSLDQRPSATSGFSSRNLHPARKDFDFALSVTVPKPHRSSECQ